MKIKTPYLCSSVVTPAAVMLMAAVYAANGLRLSAPIVDGQLTETFFPTIVALLCIIACIALLIKAVREIKAKAGEAEVREIKVPVKAFLTMALMAVFVLLFETLGFVVLAPFFVFGFMMIYDDKPQQIGRKIIYSIIISALVFVLYEVCFDIRFPELWG